MENNNKTQAEIYREERKERLAKAAAKNAKKSPKTMKAKRIAKKVVSIVLAVAIALAAVGGVLNFFDVPEKTIKVSVDGIDTKISLAEINYYYYQSWYQFFSYAQQYESYGEGMGLSMTGFDYTKSPESQEYTEQAAQIAGVALEDLGDIENPTWKDAFTYSAVNQLVYAKYGAMKAEEADIKLADEEIDEIKTQIESIRKTAKEKDYSLDRWLRLNFGAGVTEKLIYNITVESSLASAYFEKVTEDTTASITDEQINAKYEADKDNYDIADIRLYSFSEKIDEKEHEDMSEEEHNAAHDAADAKSKEKAESFLKEVKDEETFINAAKNAILAENKDSKDDADKKTLVEGASYSTLTSYTEDLAKWVYDDARKVGDTTVISDGEGTYYVVMMKELPHKNTTISSSDVRHILVQFPDENTDGTPTSTKDSSGKTTTNITDETKAATKAEAEKILEEFKKNPTEDNFAALAKEKTDDTASAESGGLFENVSDNGQYVEAFTDWAIDATRKPGDTGIVETEYGYHIMYYVQANAETWYLTIQNEILNETLQETVASVIDEYVDSVDTNSFFINWTIKKENKHIGEIILSNT